MSLFSRTPTTKEQIQDEIDNLMNALHDLQQSASRDSRRSIHDLSDRAERLWHASRETFGDTYGDLSRKTLKASRAAGECARQHPLSTALVGVGALALIGWLISRR
ncbi:MULTISPECIES: YqjD family protein [Pseudomonas]|uniref:DUF883 family protein n=1 Tax=Pseudomonas TaxID=286 RepID=UPI00249A03F8|nr:MULTISPECIES: DUF883 domain-containing protein [Pseudomonas]